MYVDVIERNIELLSNNNFFLAISNDEWKHEIDDQSYLLLYNTKADTLQQIFSTKDFLKFSVKIDFTEWNIAGERFSELFDVLMKLISGY